ncbi:MULTISPECIES: glycosyltransferase family 2 protein [Spirulina sp. CCY15215]|uniref:glycosyltransferase family 2 protein n=1 Tax=Spirulina sp. CCY15215 TaxID=2767591 RepID=UPI0019507B17|nr:glycosyltransferase family 2 protein [Spirulina major]
MVLKFSVITPSYNQGRFIDRTIQSVLKQSDRHFEYLICDGRSTDNTLEIIQQYEGQLTWLSECDRGQADAVNKGISRTTGEIIAWLNSDDIYYPQTLQTVREIFTTYPQVQVVYGDADIVDAKDNIIGSYPTHPWNYHYLKQICYLCQPAVFFRRQLVDKYGSLNSCLEYCMDYELWLRYGAKTPFYYLPQKLAASRSYSANKTNRCKVAVHAEINKMLDNRLGYVPDRWILGYARILTDENWHNLSHTSQGDRDYINTVIVNCYREFTKWQKVPSLYSCVRLFYWWIQALINPI